MAINLFLGRKIRKQELAAGAEWRLLHLLSALAKGQQPDYLITG